MTSKGNFQTQLHVQCTAYLYVHVYVLNSHEYVEQVCLILHMAKAFGKSTKELYKNYVLPSLVINHSRSTYTKPQLWDKQQHL